MAEEANKETNKEAKKEEKPKYVMFNNMKYIPLPAGILKEMRPGGILRQHHEKIIDDTYNAMLRHKAYYEKIMQQWDYHVKDPIPIVQIIRDVLFKFETYLFGWFAFKMEPQYNYVLEDAVRLMGEYIEDTKAEKTPRCLRDM